MASKNNFDSASETGEKISQSEIAEKVELLRSEMRSEKAKLTKIGTPFENMRLRAERAESALKESDIALQALEALQRNSVEIIRAADTATLALKATIVQNEKDAQQRQVALDALTKIVEKNRKTIESSAITISALNNMAYNDPLTGLPNRRLLADRLHQVILNNKRWESFSAVIFIDLDKFKRLNDEFGHEVGDALLIQFGSRLQHAVRETDTVARYGGDEFVILLSKLTGSFPDARAEVEVICNKILNTINPVFILKSHSKDEEKNIEYHARASLGVTMFDGELDCEPTILDWADEAMYWAKSEGGSTFRFYDSVNSVEQTLTALYNLAIENDDETANHGIRTRQYMKTLAHRAQQMNLYPDEISNEVIERLFKTTQLHDIGKSKIPYAINHKPGVLTPEEWVVMKTHTTLGAQILEEAKKQNKDLTGFLNTAIDVAVAHHEHWDGSGYPKGLSGTKIPLAGRLMAIADVYDALISKRIYKEPWSHEDAVAEIISKSGRQFDPYLISAFIREQENFRLIAESAKD